MSEKEFNQLVKDQTERGEVAAVEENNNVLAVDPEEEMGAV